MDEIRARLNELDFAIELKLVELPFLTAMVSYFFGLPVVMYDTPLIRTYFNDSEMLLNLLTLRLSSTRELLEQERIELEPSGGKF